MAIPSVKQVGTRVAGATTISVAWPTHETGDLGLLCIVSNHNVSLNPISGWTYEGYRTSGPNSSAPGNNRVEVFSRIASSNAEANVPITVASNTGVQAVITTWKDFDPVDFVDAVGYGSRSSSAPSSPSSLTGGVVTTEPNTRVVTFAFADRDNATSAFTSISGQDNTHINVGTASGSGSSMLICDKAYASAGDTGSVEANLAVLDGGWGFFQIALRGISVSPIVGTTSMTFADSASMSGSSSLSASQPVAFTHGATLLAAGVLAAVMGVSFSSDATLSGNSQLTAAGGITFSQTANAGAYALASATESIVFGHIATGTTSEGTAGNTLMTFGQSGALVGAGALSANTPFNFAQTAGVSGTALMQASTSMTFGHSATGRVDAFLIGNTTLGLSEAWAIPVGVTALSAMQTMTFGQSGAMVASGALAATTTMTFGHTAAGISGAFLFGNTTLAFGGSGTLNAGTSSGASAPMSFTQTATLRGNGGLVGTIPSTFTLLGTGKSWGYVVGSTTMTFAQTGALSSIVNPIYGDTWRNKWLAVYATRQILLNKIADHVKGIADSKIKTYISDTAPTVGLSIGDMWFNTVTKVLRRWDGTSWGDTADATTAVVGTAIAIRNPEFEQGLLHWGDEAGGTIWSVEAGQGYLSGSAAKMQSGSFSGERQLTGQTYVPARPGQRYRASCMVKRTGSAAGTPYISITWLGPSGYLGHKVSEVVVTPNGEYVLLKVEDEAPAGVIQFRVYLGVVGYAPSGAWYFDSVKKEMIAEGPAMRKNEDNFVLNFDFEGGPLVQTDSGLANYDPNVLPPKWTRNFPGVPWPTSIRYDYDFEFEGSRSLLMTGPLDSGLVYEDVMPVVPGEKLVVAMALKGEQIGGAVATVACYGPSGMTGQYHISNDAEALWQVKSTIVTVPAGSTDARLLLRQGAAGTYWCSFDRIRWARQKSMDNDVGDGLEYVRYPEEDAYYYGGKYRDGLRVPGSGYIIGDQRNLPQSNTTSYGSIRNTTALTADSSGNVSINAHTVRYGGVNVSYSAVTNAVTGLTVGNTYVIYCFDDYYAGGTRTWYAGNSPDAVMQLGDGVVIAGQITIPASGTSGGGGGGGGGNPEEWCVDYDSVLPDGRLVRDLQVGDLVECIDVVTGERGMFPLLAMGEGYEECFSLHTPQGDCVVQSRSTPMNLPDGTVCSTRDMLGKPVWTPSRLTYVSNLFNVGVRRVLKPDLGDRMFFAGVTASTTIATHNIRFKP